MRGIGCLATDVPLYKAELPRSPPSSNRFMRSISLDECTCSVVLHTRLLFVPFESLARVGDTNRNRGTAICFTFVSLTTFDVINPLDPLAFGIKAEQD